MSHAIPATYIEPSIQPAAMALINYPRFLEGTSSAARVNTDGTLPPTPTPATNRKPICCRGRSWIHRLCRFASRTVHTKRWPSHPHAQPHTHSSNPTARPFFTARYPPFRPATPTRLPRPVPPIAPVRSACSPPIAVRAFRPKALHACRLATHGIATTPSCP
jgi:hypothetical protein